MTPFGIAIRKLRAERGVTQRDMARAIGVSAAYLSALEHGQRAQPSWDLVQRIIGYFNVIWDDAEELQRLATLSQPRVKIDTSSLSAKAMELAKRLSVKFALLGDADLDRIEKILDNMETSTAEPSRRPKKTNAKGADR